MSRGDQLANLAGYSTLAIILGTAEWSSFGWFWALPLVGGTLAYAGLLAFEEIMDRARATVGTASPASPDAIATDGGQEAEA